MDEQSKQQIKDALLQYDRTLLVADPRRSEPKKWVRLNLLLFNSCHEWAVCTSTNAASRGERMGAHAEQQSPTLAARQGPDVAARLLSVNNASPHKEVFGSGMDNRLLRWQLKHLLTQPSQVTAYYSFLGRPVLGRQQDLSAPHTGLTKLQAPG